MTLDSDSNRDRILKAALGCRSELIAYARSLLGKYSAAEDAVQEAMLVVVKKFDQFEDGTSILAWCRAIVRIEVLRSRRKSQREQSVASRLLDDAVHASFEEFQSARRNEEVEKWRVALGKCIENVPEQGRGVLMARFVDELSYEKIGERIGMSIEAVRKSLFRLKKQVRSCVETKMRAIR